MGGMAASPIPSRPQSSYAALYRGADHHQCGGWPRQFPISHHCDAVGRVGRCAADPSVMLPYLWLILTLFLPCRSGRRPLSLYHTSHPQFTSKRRFRPRCFGAVRCISYPDRYGSEQRRSLDAAPGGRHKLVCRAWDFPHLANVWHLLNATLSTLLMRTAILSKPLGGLRA